MKSHPTAKGPIASVIYFPGTNCEQETIAALQVAGARPKLVFIEDLLRRRVKVTDTDLAWIAGGFSYGDYIDTGVVAALFFRELLQELIAASIPILGICNGFQILMRAGAFGSGITLTRNASNTFMSVPARHLAGATPCIWTKNLAGRTLHFPAAHGSGRVAGKIDFAKVILTYQGESPNGALVAGLTANQGLIAGIMCHPERPFGNPDGMLIIQNGVDFVRQNR